MGMVMNALAEKVWSAGVVLRETEFGSTLRNARRSGGGSTGSGGVVPQGLRRWELSFDPAVQRTFAAVSCMQAIGEALPDNSNEWLKWNLSARRAVQRIAAKCWAGIPRDVWQQFIDFDDIAPGAMRGEISEVRRDARGVGALRFAGLDEDPSRSVLSALFVEIKTLDMYDIADRAAARITNNPISLRELTAERAKAMSGLTVTPGETGAEYFERCRNAVSNSYASYPEVLVAVRSLRAYNRLVLKIIWALLGLCEQIEPARITETSGPLSDSMRNGERIIDLTVTDPLSMFLRPTHPVWIALSTPLDGLYFVEGHTMALGGPGESDLHLVAFEPPGHF
jgi:hypothetical protein